MRIFGLLGALALLALSAPAANAWTGAAMATLGRFEAPIGWRELCGRSPGICAARAAARGVRVTPEGAVALTEARRAELEGVNRAVNAEIRQATDFFLYGREEVWTLPREGAGDCEDIALLKRERLKALGWPTSALLMTVVRDGRGEGHAVLTVRTDAGDLVLDNRRDAILDWRSTGYRYYIRQAATNPRDWVAIGREAPVYAASTIFDQPAN